MKKSFPYAVLVCILLFPTSSITQQAPSLPALKQEAVVEVDKMQTLTQQMVDEIFRFSELGFQEVETSRCVAGILEKKGFRVERGVAGIPTAWIATYGSGKPVIAYITDIDCIPRASQSLVSRITIPSWTGRQATEKDTTRAWRLTSPLLSRSRTDGRASRRGHDQNLPRRGKRASRRQAFSVREGLFKDVDIVLGAHVGSEFSTSYGVGNGEWSGLVSIQYFSAFNIRL